MKHQFKQDITLDEVFEHYADRKRRWYAISFGDFVDFYIRLGYRII